MNLRTAVIGTLITIALPLGLAGCGSSGAADQPAGTAAQQGEAGVFPTTVKHKFGSTTVDKAPQKVVALGYTDQDSLLALDVVPTVVRDWDGMVPGGGTTGPWVSAKLGGARPEVYKAEQINPESIAAMRPDLIVAVYSGIDQPTYDALSKIAPVLAQTADYPDYGQPWDVTLTEIGQSVGKPAAAKKLVDDTRARFTALAARHPDWKGKTVTVATTDNTKLSVFGPTDGRTRFFTDLGFTASPQLRPITGDKFYGNLSMEQADKLESQLLVFDQLTYTPGGRDAIAGNPALAKIPAVAQNRTLYLDELDEKAFGWQTLPAINFLLDRIEEPVVKVTRG